MAILFGYSLYASLQTIAVLPLQISKGRLKFTKTKNSCLDSSKWTFPNNFLHGFRNFQKSNRCKQPSENKIVLIFQNFVQKTSNA